MRARLRAWFARAIKLAAILRYAPYRRTLRRGVAASTGHARTPVALAYPTVLTSAQTAAGTGNVASRAACPRYNRPVVVDLSAEMTASGRAKAARLGLVAEIHDALIKDPYAPVALLLGAVRRVVRPAGDGTHTGRLAERYAYMGIDDHELVRAMQGLGLEVLVHERHHDARTVVVRLLLRRLHQPSSFSLLLRRTA